MTTTDMYNNNPEELRQLPRWVAYTADKKPINPVTGCGAKANDAVTWGTFEQAVAKVGQSNIVGIGFELGGGYIGIDIDRCIVDGNIAPTVDQTIKAMNTYTEISPSGKGIHLIYKGTLPEGHCKKNIKDGQIFEIYSQQRYFTMTGNKYPNTPASIAERTAEGTAFYHMYVHNGRTTSTTGAAQGARSFLTDDDIIKRVTGDPAWVQLWQGDYSAYDNDHSAADQALCNRLAFLAGRDTEQMDRVFRRSGLMRDKWDVVHDSRGRTYGQMTIDSAVAGTPNVYDPEYSRMTPVEDFADGFPSWPFKYKNGQPMKHWKNTAYACGLFKVTFRFNEVSKMIETESPEYKNLTADSISVDLQSRLVEIGYKLTVADIDRHITLIAEKNKYNPVQDYLKECRAAWDGKSRIADVFGLFTLDPESKQNPKLCFELLKRWLITCVLMAFNEGKYTQQGVLTLRGPQGIGKTRILDYFLDGHTEWGLSGVMVDLDNKDSLVSASRCWIVEFGEYGRNLGAKRANDYKAYITRPTDDIRLPYSRSWTTYPRRTAFYGSTDAETFLQDAAGERRHWVISITGIKDEARPDMAQVWGEVYHLALETHYPHYLTTEEIQRLNEQNGEYKSRSDEYMTLYDSINWEETDKTKWLWVTSTEVARILGMKGSNRAIGKALTEMADGGALPIWKNRKTSLRKYAIPPFKSNTPICFSEIELKQYRLGALGASVERWKKH